MLAELIVSNDICNAPYDYHYKEIYLENYHKKEWSGIKHTTTIYM